MQFETVSTGPVNATNPQNTQKNGWTCVNWYNTVFEIAARNTSRIFGHVVAGFVSVFTFIPSLTVDLTHAVINLYDRNISRPETPLENQVSTAVLPPSVSGDKSAHSLQSSMGLTPARKQLPSSNPYNCCFFKMLTKRFEFRVRYTQLDCKKPVCSHLFIPETNPVHSLLIQPELRTSIKISDNMQSYCSQTGLFDEAVRDITSELLDGCIHPLRKRVGLKHVVRYDNLPLYKVSIDGVEQGGLGLIDREKMKLTHYDKTLRSITRIFPYHYDIIKEEADRRGIPYNDEILKADVADGKKHLAVGYEDHCKWLQEKGVLDKFEDLNLGLSQERMNDVKKAVEKELISMNEGKILVQKDHYTVRSPEGFLKDGATSAKILAGGITETIIKNLTREINENFLQNVQGKNPDQLTKSNLVKIESFLTEYDKIIDGVSTYFRPSDHYEEIPHDKTCFAATLSDYMTGKLVSVIFDELVNGREMLAYNTTQKPIPPL